jgi:hypothetical protein
MLFILPHHIFFYQNFNADLNFSGLISIKLIIKEVFTITWNCETTMPAMIEMKMGDRR